MAENEPGQLKQTVDEIKTGLSAIQKGNQPHEAGLLEQAFEPIPILERAEKAILAGTEQPPETLGEVVTQTGREFVGGAIPTSPAGIAAFIAVNPVVKGLSKLFPGLAKFLTTHIPDLLKGEGVAGAGLPKITQPGAKAASQEAVPGTVPGARIQEVPPANPKPVIGDERPVPVNPLDPDLKLIEAMPGHEILSTKMVPVKGLKGHPLPKGAESEARTQAYAEKFKAAPETIPSIVKDTEGNILQGSRRLEAAIQAGLKEVPATEVRITPLTKEQLTGKAPITRFDFDVIPAAEKGKPIGVKLSELDFRTPATIEAAVKRVVLAKERAGHVVPEATPGAEGHVVIPESLSRDIGKTLGMNEAEIEAMASDPRIGTAQLSAMSDVVKSSWVRLKDVIKTTKSDPSIQNQDLAMNFLNQHNLLFTEMRRLGTEAGQTLRGFGYEETAELVGQGRQLQNILALRSANNEIPNMTILNLVDNIGLSGMGKALKMVKETSWKAFNNIMYFSFLSSPATQSANTIGSAIIMPLNEIATRKIASLLPYTRARAYGANKIVDELAGPVSSEEASAGWTAYKRAVRNAISSATSIYTNEGAAGLYRAAGDIQPIRPELRKIGTLKLTSDDFNVKSDAMIGAAVNMVGEILHTPQIMMRVEDNLARMIAADMSASMAAIRSGRNLGMEGDALLRHVNGLLDNPTPAMAKGMQDFSEAVTFTQKLTGMSLHAQNMFANPVLKTQAPFIPTMMNIFNTGLKHTPIGVFYNTVRDDLLSGGSRQQMAAARMIYGSVWMASAVPTLFYTDLITGDGPLDSGQKALWLKEHTPRSIGPGKFSVSYDRFQPIGNWLHMVAKGADIIRYSEDPLLSAKVGMSLVMSTMQMMVNETWSGNLYKLLDLPNEWAHAGPRTNKDKLMSQTERLLGEFTKIGGPAGLGAIGGRVSAASPAIGASLFLAAAAAGISESRFTAGLNKAFFDDQIKAIDGFYDTLKADIPFLSKEVSPRRDFLYGKPETAQMAEFGFFLPIRIGMKHEDPIVSKIVDELGMIPPVPEMTINGERLSKAEHDQWIVTFTQEAKITGMRQAAYLHKLINQDWFKKLTPGPQGGQAAEITRSMQMFQDEGKRIMADKYKNPKFLGYDYKEKRIMERTGVKVKIPRPAGVKIAGEE